MNVTLISLYEHMKEYEKIKYHIIIFDQGTIELRYNSNNIFNIFNYFFFNPNGYAYTYNVIFSYLYSRYALLIDDDRPIRKNIENFVYYKNFIEICMNIMDKRKDIYGFLLKKEVDGKAICYKEIKNKTPAYCKVVKAYIGYYYSNGASIYKSKILKKVNSYIKEKSVADYISKTRYRMAYLCNIKSCKGNIYKCNYLIDHIGKNSSLGSSKICSMKLY